MASITTAPTDGSSIELLVDGQWIQAYWSERAYDGSPYGIEGWAQVEGGYFILDEEAWRPINDSYGEDTELKGHRRRQPIIVLGLAFGDEAKGATVDFLSSSIPDAAAVVRWSGGANAAHNVKHGHRHHTFRQFGSGTLLGLPTFLNNKVVLNLPMLMAEAVELENNGVTDPLSLIILHSDSVVTTPIHIALNRAREILRGINRHGSCGLGIGETIAHTHADRHGEKTGNLVGNFSVPGKTYDGRAVITAGMLLEKASSNENGSTDNSTVKDRIVKALELQESYAMPLIKKASLAAPELIEQLYYEDLDSIATELIQVANSVDIFSASNFEEELFRTMELGTVIFEGSQGVLLDQEWGFHPHTTWAKTEPSELVDWLQSVDHEPYVLGLTRSYGTRHGEGPLPSENAISLSESDLPSDHNSWGRWQGGFRVAALDVPLLKYSLNTLRHSGITLDGLSVSHMDAFKNDEIPVVIEYDGKKNPAGYWRPDSDNHPFFPSMDSDVFLQDFITSKKMITVRYSSNDLLSYLTRTLETPLVITASGPNRRDRKLIK